MDGGAETVLRALRNCVGVAGTIVVPAFTGDVITDPHPDCRTAGVPEVEAARSRVPLFHDAFPTSMGALPTAVLAQPDRLRSRHPQVSVGALGAVAEDITEHQPFAYALGANSPFSRLYELDARILMLGVGHGERLWLEAPDVGDDNGTHFPQAGAEWADRGQVRHQVIGTARCELVDAVPFINFARTRLSELLCG